MTKYEEDEDEKDGSYPKNLGSGGGIISLIILIAICWWGYNSFIKKDYSKPWWEGVASQKVCSTGDNQNCYTLSVYSDGQAIESISFPNGGYVRGDSECFKAASFSGYDQFCRFFDQQGRKWDVIPV